MRFVAIVELSTSTDTEPAHDLLRSAYQASRRGPVALLVPEESARTVDRALDPLVTEDRHVHGVRYARATDDAMWAAASPSTVVVASSAAVQTRARAIGAACLDRQAAVDMLHRLGTVHGAIVAQRAGS